MADIKTRDTVKGTIKTLDKAAVAGQKMKQAYIATKDKAERTVNANENTAEEYAADKVEAGMDDISHKAVYVLDRAGRKGVRDTKSSDSKRECAAFQTAKSRTSHECAKDTASGFCCQKWDDFCSDNTNTDIFRNPYTGKA